MRTLLKMVAFVCMAAGFLLSSGCMTSTVIHDARHPKPTDATPWANYLLLPLTLPADIATSPIQIPAYISYARGERPRRVIPKDSSTSARD